MIRALDTKNIHLSDPGVVKKIHLRIPVAKFSFSYELTPLTREKKDSLDLTPPPLEQLAVAN